MKCKTYKTTQGVNEEGKGPEHILSEQTCFSVIIFQEHILTVLETESGIAF